ncbi:MAG: hypothetical protein O7E52_00625 [Candidatus Poribacteria bacterium]|nr:hypothetical protein [Candidatus Poribacteria bacterium]
MRSHCMLWIVLLQIAVLTYGGIGFAGTWRDDFEDRNTREWTIYNLDRQVENWWVNKGEAVGRIFKRGFMSLWLTGELDWKNYSLSCRAKLVNEKNDPPSLGLTLHDRGDEDTRYLFSIDFLFGTVEITKATPNRWFTRTFPFVAEIDTWYRLKATANDGQLEFQVNDQIFTSEDPEPLKPGQAGLVVANAEARFDDVTVTGLNIKNGGPGRPRAVDVKAKLAITWGQIKSERR